jgi:hypothetical protein
MEVGVQPRDGGVRLELLPQRDDDDERHYGAHGGQAEPHEPSDRTVECGSDEITLQRWVNVCRTKNAIDN